MDMPKKRKRTTETKSGEKLDGVILPNLPGMAYRCKYDRDWTMLYISEGCYDLTGYTVEELIGNRRVPYNQIINPEYREPIWEEWKRILARRDAFRFEYEITTASGEIRWVLETGWGIYDRDGNVEALEGIIIDVTERKERELHIKYLYEHDYLTGLYNRRYFEKILTEDAERIRSANRAVLLVNLRKFTNLNITYGYHYGESLVKELVQKLTTLCNEDTRLFHISVDRYAFYTVGYSDRNDLVEFCASVAGILGISPALKTTGWSIGIYEIGQGEGDPDAILKNASIAASYVDMNASGYSFFDDEMERKLLRSAAIKEELSVAASLDDDPRLYLVYQPILDLKQNGVHGFEALARFRCQKLGDLSPAEFIPFAEESALIVPLGRRIIRRALEFIKELGGEGYEDLLVSVNVSTIQLLDDGFVESLLEIFGEVDVDPCKLCLEITESVFSSNYEEINRTLRILRELGIKVALDDFGTGYSSLSRESELNVDIVKIDKYFIGKLETVSSPETIIGDIISIIHKLGHTVVAEGVENAIQRDYLVENDCDLIQGYLIGKPLAHEEAMEFLREKHFS